MVALRAPVPPKRRARRPAPPRAAGGTYRGLMALPPAGKVGRIRKADRRELP